MTTTPDNGIPLQADVGVRIFWRWSRRRRGLLADW